MELGLGNIYSKKKPTKNPLVSDNTLSNSSRSSYSSKRLEQEKLAADMANQPEQKTLKSYFFDDFMESGIKFSAISPSFYDEPQKKIFTYNPEQLSFRPLRWTSIHPVIELGYWLSISRKTQRRRH